ncbi:MAG: peptidylprolyl isomerase [Methanosarcinaceae archaeon]|nr:peptidylprolyl isomerase [Methanosarcinaceae archaeon]
MTVKEGNTVKVEYTGMFDDGTVFDSSEKHDKPLEFEVGARQMIPGFEDAVLGMNIGDEKSIKLGPAQAYGEHREDLIKAVPREQMPPEQRLEVGMGLLVSLPDGTDVPAKVIDITDDTITIDLNHPLAGADLSFEIKLVDITT